MPALGTKFDALKFLFLLQEVLVLLPGKMIWTPLIQYSLHRRHEVLRADCKSYWCNSIQIKMLQLKGHCQVNIWNVA